MLCGFIFFCVALIWYVSVSRLQNHSGNCCLHAVHGSYFDTMKTILSVFLDAIFKYPRAVCCFVNFIMDPSAWKITVNLQDVDPGNFTYCVNKLIL